MGKIEIHPKKVITTTILKYIEISDGVILLGNSAKFPVKIFDENGNLNSVEFVEISGDDYEKWGSDDSHISKCIMSKIGVKVYDEKLIKLAESLTSGVKDGRISKSDADKLISKIKSDEEYTDIEKETLLHIKDSFKWTDAANKWFESEIERIFK